MKHAFSGHPMPPMSRHPHASRTIWLRQFFAKNTCLAAIVGPCHAKAKPLPLPLVDPASHPPPGFRAMLIRRVKMKYPEMSESQIARYVGCSPSNVHQVLKSFLACRPIRDRIFRF